MAVGSKARRQARIWRISAQWLPHVTLIWVDTVSPYANDKIIILMGKSTISMVNATMISHYSILLTTN